MDFYRIKERSVKRGVTEVYPDFIVGRSKDLMVRGRSFYAIWDEARGLWSTDEYDVQRIVDADLYDYKDRMVTEDRVVVKTLGDFSSNMWIEFRNYMSHVSDNSVQLDEKLTFSNTEVKKSDYRSKRLAYPLEQGGSFDAYDELISCLYSEEERRKLEWAIGAIVSGDSRDIQKFIVLYGEAGTGKSTVLNIIQQLFDGYYITFEAKTITSSNNAFATEVFKSNPLVAIQHDGDLSRIEDNSKLNSIVSHEEMTMNEKYKPSYTSRVNAFLFMGTNKPVKITDAKSGIIRRLIDVHPTGKKIPVSRYHTLMEQIKFELGGIAYHCLEVYRELGKNYYMGYRPVGMILQTDVFYNFVEDSYFQFKENDGVSLKAAYEIYKKYCDEALVDFKLPRHKFREELKNYFRNFEDITRIDGKQVRSYYSGFISEKFTRFVEEKQEKPPCSLVMDETVSILDDVLADCPAQYANEEGTPFYKWSEIKTTLKSINTNRLHYVKVPENHIVIDFDIKDENGEKSFEKNVEAASKWPPTYAELSKSGKGVHLHYIYEGDTSKLSRIYDKDIEVKVFTGNGSLRRLLTYCNSVPIATISSGLPLKGGRKKVLDEKSVKDERHLRAQINKALKGEVHANTKPNICFIDKVLNDAYTAGFPYDVSDLKNRIIVYANNSTHNAPYCLDLVSKMKFKSEDDIPPGNEDDSTIVFFDVEVFPNLFIVVWKKKGGNKVTLINPSAARVRDMFSMRLIGFNNRQYDNHIIYAAGELEYTIPQLYELSSRIIADEKNVKFGQAYNLSYADIYDYSSKKQSLKKWEIALGIHHNELGLPWDQPVPEELWPKVAEYCGDDVDATEAVFSATEQDFVARKLLSDLSGLTVNDTTQQQTAKILFGDERSPQSKFIYTDLSKMFPGYKYEFGKSTYRGEVTGEGGYVYAEPGIWENVALIDVESMHPSSIELLNLFGPYTKNFSDLKAARLAIKHEDYEKAKTMLNGKLAPYLGSKDDAESLSYALKIVINIVYGLTSASFPNKFKDPRNKDNIVAKRGALFMIDLKHAVQEKGFTVAHIKTDSIKIPNATPEIIQFVMDFGKKYGYNFDHEATYERMCLVNDAVYIAKYETAEKCNSMYGYMPKDNRKHGGEWTATGAQFQKPIVFKKLFSKEEITFADLCETKNVTSAMYLDMNEGLPKGEHNYVFVGKTGSYCPVKPGTGGGELLREKNGKYSAVVGTKGYRWLESEIIKDRKLEDNIDMSYYQSFIDEAISAIDKYGDFEWFSSDIDCTPPWD